MRIIIRICIWDLAGYMETTEGRGKNNIGVPETCCGLSNQQRRDLLDSLTPTDVFRRDVIVGKVRSALLYLYDG